MLHRLMIQRTPTPLRRSFNTILSWTAGTHSPKSRPLLQTLTLFLLLFIGLPASPLQAQTSHAEPWNGPVVVTAEEHATRAGLEILDRGGNAVDAAVAVQFALAVTLPRAGNIGGGGFMVLQLEDGTTRALDFREKAPKLAHRDMFLDREGEYQPEVSRRGALASGVPGTVDGMINALEHHGRLPLEVVMRPAIRLAEQGFSLNHTLAEELNHAADELSQFDASARYFLRQDGREWRRGDRFVQRDLATTLRRIAERGRRGFYEGVTAQRIVETMRRNGGWMRYEDLQNYESQWRDPILSTFNGYQLAMMPPPSSGGLVIQQVLGMIEAAEQQGLYSRGGNEQNRDAQNTNPQSENEQDLNPTGQNLRKLGFNSAAYIHLISETLRRSFADRNYHLGDPDFVEIPSRQLTHPDYYRERMAGFDPQRATLSSEIQHGEVALRVEPDETTHFSILDEDGNAVSVTTTLNGSFGNMLAVDGGGFLLNNEMDDFSAKPGEPNMFGLIGAEANAIEPGKRMLSSMSPTIVSRDGEVRIILGAAGGPRIITAVLQNILNVTVFGMNPAEAISAGRFHHQWLPDEITTEPFAISPDTKALLEERGHRVGVRDHVGRVHMIVVDEEGRRYGVADPRGDGFSLGMD